MRADLDELHSDTALDIPWHVRQYLQKYERCTDDRKLLASMETQVIVLRAIGMPPWLHPAFCHTFMNYGASPQDKMKIKWGKYKQYQFLDLALAV